jgi:hypothetical protein
MLHVLLWRCSSAVYLQDCLEGLLVARFAMQKFGQVVSREQWHPRLRAAKSFAVELTNTSGTQ